MVAGPEQTRILIVSASPYTRYVISGELGSKPDLFVVGTARSLEELTYKRALLRPDLVVVDLERSRDLSDLQRTLAEISLPVLVLCSHTDDGAELAFAALKAGAADVIARPANGWGNANFTLDLLHKVRGVARANCRRAARDLTLGAGRAPAWCWPNSAPGAKVSPRSFLPGDRLIVVSTTAGGLGLLVQLLATLPGHLRGALLVLSALPPRYLSWFLRHAAPATAFHLRPARDGLPLKSGVAYFALDDYHLTVGVRGHLALDRGPRRNQVRPSIDVTLSSLATQYGPAVMAVFMSGSGRDGVQGARDVYAAGGTVVVQEPETCPVDETPAAIVTSGVAMAVLPPERIADEIVQRALVEV